MSGGGRPRDPDVDRRVLSSAVTILAVHRLPGFTADELAAHAGVGKASIYRRWSSMHALLAEIVDFHLGVEPVDYGLGRGTAAGDVAALLTAACTGARALAEAAVQPLIGLHTDLQAAYFRGPTLRFAEAVRFAAGRALDRGEVWSSVQPLRAGHGALMQRVQVTGLQPPPSVIDSVVAAIVPGLLAPSRIDSRWPAAEHLTPSATGALVGGPA